MLWAVLPRLLSLAVVIHALVNIYVDARSDLVVRRLRLGKYRIKAQYKLPDRTVQSNSVKVEVGSTVESARTTAR
jgi:hypothetical protein